MRAIGWRRLAATVFVAAVATLPLAAQNRRTLTIDDILGLKSVGGPTISPDGKWIVYTYGGWEHPNAKGDTAKGDKHEQKSHLWLISTDPSGGPPRQITFGATSEGGAQWSPDGKYLSFTAVRTLGSGEGDGKSQVYLMRMDGGEASRLTNIKDGVSSYNWSPDGSKLAFVQQDPLSTEEEAKRKRNDDPLVYEDEFRQSHIWIFDVNTKAATRVTQGKTFTVSGLPSWSPDGTRLAFNANLSNLARDERREAYLVTLGSNQIEKIAIKDVPQGTPTWSPDGKTLAIATLIKENPDFPDGLAARTIRNNHLVLYDVASKNAKDIYDAKFDKSMGGVQWAPDGKKFYFSAGDGAYSSFFSYDMGSGKYTQITKNMSVSGISASKDFSKITFAMATPKSPSDVYLTDLTFTNMKKLTDGNPQLANVELGEAEVVRWKSSDGWDVEGVLIKPVGYQQGQKYPLLVDIHGGPTGSHSNGFHASTGDAGQFFAGKGWAVLYPNPRGSTGYGEKFMRGNIPDWGGGDYKDIMTGVDALISRGIADSSKLAVMGWSYGGYMTAWVVSQTSRFKAAMMGAGLSDMLSMYGTTDIPGYIASFYNGGPLKENLPLYAARSAITYADQITTPLLILHGGSDTRVPTGQATEYYRAIKDRGKTVQLVFYPREGHGLGEYYHIIDRLNRQYDWIVKYTLNGGRTSTEPKP